jgi:lactate dehydrogenase-like 2-hydroxyacid dehydrogenase
MLKVILFIVVLALIIAVAVLHVEKEKLKKEYMDLLVLNEKNIRMLQIMTYWRQFELEFMPIDEYLKGQNINKVAIYGMGVIGNALLDELTGTPVEVAYAIDNGNGTGWNNKVRIITKDEKLEDVDAIIITIVDDDENIRNALKSVSSIRTIYLEEIVCWK